MVGSPGESATPVRTDPRGGFTGRAVSPAYIHSMRLPRFLLSAAGVLLLGAPIAAQKPPPRAPAKGAPAKSPPAPQAAPSAPPTTGYFQGVAIDSVHGEPLVGALIQLEGYGRMGISDSLRRLLVDSIKPG